MTSTPTWHRRSIDGIPDTLWARIKAAAALSTPPVSMTQWLINAAETKLGGH